MSKSRSSRDVDSLRSLMSSMPPFNMLAAGALAGSSDPKRSREQEMREALENLSKASPELFARALPDDKKFSFPSMEMMEKTLKRTVDQNSTERPSKRPKDMISPITIPVPHAMTTKPNVNRESSSSESGIDLTSTVKAKSPDKHKEKFENIDAPQSNVLAKCDSQIDKPDDMTKQKSDMADDIDDKNGNGKKNKKGKVKKLSVEENVERKNLRSAGRSTRAKSHSRSPSPTT